MKSKTSTLNSVNSNNNRKNINKKLSYRRDSAHRPTLTTQW